jgi:dTDP-4-amino-4,6-dideoxygalactose transaminase
MKAIMKIAQDHKLKVLEDCAQAHGAKIEGQHVGTFGDAASFSFYPGKNLGAYGDAGCMVTNDSETATNSRRIANHGQEGKHNHIVEGRNSRLDAIQAGILNVKLPHLENWIQIRNKIGINYIKKIVNPKIQLPVIPPSTYHAFHLFVIRTENRTSLIHYLRENDIGSAIHYPVALPFMKCYKHFNCSPENFPIAYEYQNKILSIPMFPELKETEIARVITVLNEY